MLLEGKSAVIYGGGGSIGGAVARAFGREGARFSSPGGPRGRWRRWPRRCARPEGRPRAPSSTPSTPRRSTSTPETIPEDFDGHDGIVELIESQTLTGKAATLEDVGNAAAFAASDWARPMTAATINVSAGALID